MSERRLVDFKTPNSVWGIFATEASGNASCGACGELIAKGSRTVKMTLARGQATRYFHPACLATLTAAAANDPLGLPPVM